MKKQWKNDQWFKSPWNFAAEVSRNYCFADGIRIHDVSIRNGKLKRGNTFNLDQKIAIAEKLSEVGIHRIEAGMPAVSSQEEAAIKELVKRNLGPEIFAYVRCTKEDIKRAAECGVKGIVVEIPSSKDIIEYKYKYSLEKAIDLFIQVTSYAKELGLYTVFFPIDMSRADMTWVLDLVQKVASEGHMDALAIVDTFGVLNPHACSILIRKTKRKFQKPIEVHFHDDFGLGAANTIMALAAGADVAHTTISSIGKREGSATYEDVVLLLLSMYGINLGLNYEKIFSAAKIPKGVSDLNIRQNRGIVGNGIFDNKSGDVSRWYQNLKDIAPLELIPYLPSLIGNNKTCVVKGKHRGLSSLDILLEDLGLTVESEDQKNEIIRLIKEKDYERCALLTIGYCELTAANISK